MVGRPFYLKIFRTARHFCITQSVKKALVIHKIDDFSRKNRFHQMATTRTYI